MRLSFRDRFVRISQPTPPHLLTPPLPVPPPFHFFFHSNCLSTIAFLSFRKKKREKKKRFSSFCPEVIKKILTKRKEKTKMRKKKKKKQKRDIFIFSFDSRFSNALLSFEKMKTFRRMEKKKKKKKRRIETKGEVGKTKRKREKKLRMRGIGKTQFSWITMRNLYLDELLRSSSGESLFLTPFVRQFLKVA